MCMEYLKRLDGDGDHRLDWDSDGIAVLRCAKKKLRLSASVTSYLSALLLDNTMQGTSLRNILGWIGLITS